MTQIVEVHVPDIGDTTGILIIEVPVSAGDVIAEDDTIVVLETDKASMDVPSPQAGKVVALKVKEGNTVSQGDLVLTLEVQNAETTAQVTATESNTASDVKTSPPEVVHSVTEPVIEPEILAAVASSTEKPVYASPSVRRFARTLGVPVEQVAGSGPKGRIDKIDVEAFVKNAMSGGQVASSTSAGLFSELPDWPEVDFEKFGSVTRQPLTRIGKLAGPTLARNSMLIPHVCNFDKADVTELEDFRKNLNTEAQADDVKLSILAFAVKATVAALKAYPKFNSSLDGEELIIKNYWNIGVAVDTPDGLVVPVVKEADIKGLREIANEMSTLAQAARDGKLKPTDMHGATFTISSLGGIGGTGFTPIINAPEVGILGMARAEIQPVWDGGCFNPRLILPLSVSWDHRVVDGVLAARFLAHIANSLSDFRRVSI